jgi:hypothetical protein
MIPIEADSGLTFSWAGRERFSLLLFACVFFSILAHATTFFLFQVVYPQRVTIPPPESKVTFLTGATPEGEALLRWIDAEDPALVASAVGQAPTWLLEVPYIPSYATVRTLPPTTVEAAPTVQFPPAKPPLDIIRSADRKPALPVAVQQKAPTAIHFSGSLATRAPSSPPPLELSVRSPTPLQTASLLIGVNEAGEVRYHFVQQSSGNPAMDTQAGEYLSRLPFAAAASPIEWSVATVNWGDDAY